MKLPAGLDVSEPWFDICVIKQEQYLSHRFNRTRNGLRNCMRWLQENGLGLLDLVMEPTGRLHELIAEAFYAKGHNVYLAQPLKFRRFAESLELRTKSDFKDAINLSIYSKERSKTLDPWVPKTDLQWELRDMQLLIRSLCKRSAALQNQLQCGIRSPYVKERLEAELEQIEDKRKEALSRAAKLLSLDPVLSSDFQLLQTIPGIGAQSAALLLTLIDFRSFQSGRALTCFLGLTKRKHDSGTSVHRQDKISKRGSTHVRSALFMPARTARIHNPRLAGFSEGLASRGKHDLKIQIAVIRKLVATCWAVITTGVPWSAEYVSPHYKPI